MFDSSLTLGDFEDKSSDYELLKHVLIGSHYKRGQLEPESNERENMLKAIVESVCPQ